MHREAHSVIIRAMPSCVFCSIIAGDLPSSRFYEDDHVLGFMDIYPWRPGHALVIPKTHAARVGELEAHVAAAVWSVGLTVAAAMRVGSGACDDVHFLLNDGRAANQTVPHVHLHVIPRRRRDLPRLVAQLLSRPLVPLRRPVFQGILDRQAARIRVNLGS